MWDVVGCVGEVDVDFGVVDYQSVGQVKLVQLGFQSFGFCFCGFGVFDDNDVVGFSFGRQGMFQIEGLNFFWQVMVVVVNNWIKCFVVVVELWSFFVVVMCVVGVFLMDEFFC